MSTEGLLALHKAKGLRSFVETYIEGRERKRTIERTQKKGVRKKATQGEGLQRKRVREEGK